MKYFKRLAILTLCTLTLPIHANAATVSNSFVDLSKNARGNLILDQNKTLEKYPAPKGSLFRSAYTFADGSVGVFATDNISLPTPSVSYSNETPLENLWARPPHDTLLRFDSKGKFLEQMKIPTMVEHPYLYKGPVNIVRNREGQFWGIHQGALVDSITTPSGGTAVIDLTSHEIVRFDQNGNVKIVDVQSFFPKNSNTITVANLTMSGDTLFINAGEGMNIYAFALNAMDGSLLYKSKYVNGLWGQLIPIQDGSLGIYKSDTAELSVFKTPLPEILSSENAEQRIQLFDLSKQLMSNLSPSLSILASGEFAYTNSGLTTVIDRSLQAINLQTMVKIQGSSDCVNCSKYSFPYLLSSNHQMLISQSEIQVQELHPISAVLNGKLLVTASPLYYDSDDGHVWVPLRAAAEAIGAIVGYDSSKRVVTLQLNGKTVTIHQDNPEVEMKTMINYSKTYVGIRALSDLLGIKVNWNQQTYTVELVSD